MAHGAPDHTRLADNAYAHYSYQRPTSGAWALAIGETRALYDLPLVGVFGLSFMIVDNKETYLRVTVDEIEIFFDKPTYVFTTAGLYKNALNGVVGCSLFDEVNNIYSLWFKTDWNVYIHKHLKVEVANIDINPCNVELIQAHILKYK